MSDGIDAHERPDPFAKLPALAERLGVKEHGPDDPPTLMLTTRGGRCYDVFDLVNAVLDRMEKSVEMQDRQRREQLPVDADGYPQEQA